MQMWCLDCSDYQIASISLGWRNEPRLCLPARVESGYEVRGQIFG